MADIIQFPGASSKVTPQDILDDLKSRIEDGVVQFVAIVTMDFDTNVKCAMTTMPAHHAIYMNQLQRMSIEQLMRDAEMIP